MNVNLVLFILVFLSFCFEGRSVSATLPIIIFIVDTSGVEDIILPENDGEIILEAKKGRGVGPSIKYMPEWEAFGFFREGNHIEWTIQIEKTKKYKVYLEWSAEGGVVGNPYVFSIGKRSLKGENKDSGSWETFIEEPIGFMKVMKGNHKVVFRPGENIEKGGGMLDVKTIRLVPE